MDAGVKGASALHGCRYCLILQSEVPLPRHSLNPPQLRFGEDMVDVINRAAGLQAFGTQAQAVALLKEHGYLSSIVCILIIVLQRVKLTSNSRNCMPCLRLPSTGFLFLISATYMGLSWAW